MGELILRKASDARIELLNVVGNEITPLQQKIIKNSTIVPISKMDDETAISSFSEVLDYIAKDVGYTMPIIPNEVTYLKARIYTFVKDYFPTISLNSLKMAFTMYVAGQLDMYLPKNSKGYVDKAHYQNFNIEYVSKVLNAYLKKEADTLEIAYSVEDKKLKCISSNKCIESYDYIKSLTRSKYEEYKATGVLELVLSEAMLIYDYLHKCNILPDVVVEEQDRKDAYDFFLKRVQTGLLNQYTVINAKKQGAMSEEVAYKAGTYAQERLIKEYFNELIEKEL